MDEGFLKLSRRFFSNAMWNEARTFSGCEAWLDLIQSARFDATPRKESIGGREISYSRGQYPASVRFLSKRWMWTEKRVRSFLSHLKKEGMIDVECNQGMNIITLRNYDEICSSGTTKGTTEDTTKGTDIYNKLNELQSEWAQLKAQLRAQLGAQPPSMGHTEGTNNKKDNNTKENTTNVVSKKDAAKAATLSRRESFYKSLEPFIGQYPEWMVQKFRDYWSELNRSGTKMRFEMEKTWETSRRLAYWAKREKSYGNDFNTHGSAKEDPGIDTGTDSLESWINSIPVG